MVRSVSRASTCLTWVKLQHEKWLSLTSLRTSRRFTSNRFTSGLGVGGGFAAVAARQQLAEIVEHRIGGGCEMGVDPLHVAQHVEMQRAGLDALDPAGADAREMRLGGARFEVAEHLLLAQQPARRTRILGHEHRR